MPKVFAGDAEQDLLDHATGAIDWHKVNASMKVRCARWASRPDLHAAMVAMRSCMMPCLHLMHELLGQAGLKWERRQQALLTQGQTREFRILEAPAIAQRVRDKINDSFHATTRAFALKDMTRRTRVLMFRMLAMAGGAVELLFRSDAGYPFRFFSLMLSGNHEKIFQDSPCLYDELTAKFVQRFPDPASLQSFEASALVGALADMIMLDIAGIESRHAAARRIHTVRSTQVSTASFETLASNVLARSIRKARDDWMLARQGVSRPVRKPRRNAPKKRAKPRRGGGPWRAFQHLEKRGFGKQKDLSTVYRQIKNEQGEEFQSLKRIGALGTLASRAGFHAFGARVRAKSARPKKGVLLGVPPILQQQLESIKTSCQAKRKAEQANLLADMSGLAQHAQEACAKLTQASAASAPGADLVQSMPASVLPVWATANAQPDLRAAPVPVLECLPLVVEMVQDFASP